MVTSFVHLKCCCLHCVFIWTHEPQEFCASDDCRLTRAVVVYILLSSRALVVSIFLMLTTIFNHSINSMEYVDDIFFFMKCIVVDRGEKPEKTFNTFKCELN